MSDPKKGAALTGNAENAAPTKKPLADALPDPVRDPDLARLVAAWPTHPEAIRRAMLALVECATRAAVPR